MELHEDSDSSLSTIPSSPLTELSRSPTPPSSCDGLKRPHAYPSPPSSQRTSQNGSPAPDAMEDKDQPPAKRRRISKERTTEYLNLSERQVSEAQQPLLDRLLRVIHKRRKIVVIAGAGISVAAGIPDFRSSTGLFSSLKTEHKLKGSGKDLFDASVYKDDSSTTHFHSMVSSMSRMTKDAKPTAFHHMLATLAQQGRLLRLYSQNVDGIDTNLEPLRTSVPLRKGKDGKWPKTVQLHGGLDKMVCSKCHELKDFDAELFDGPTPPPCSSCVEINDLRTNHQGKRSHGIGCLRPRMVLYNEHNPDDEAIGAVTREDLRRRPDAVIVVGTTLKVPGVRRIVKEMCGMVRDHRDGVAIWINNDPPPSGAQLENCWDIIVNGPADEVAQRAALRQWDEPEPTLESISVNTSFSSEDLIIPARPYPDALPALPLLSAAHLNNSFKAPLPGLASVYPRSSPDYSPMRTKIRPSIKLAQDGPGALINGLLTPTKSIRNSPSKASSIAFGVLGKTGPNKQASRKNPATKKQKQRSKKGFPRGNHNLNSSFQVKKHTTDLAKDMDKASKLEQRDAPMTPRKSQTTNNIGRGSSVKPFKSPSKFAASPRPKFPGFASLSENRIVQ